MRHSALFAVAILALAPLAATAGESPVGHVKTVAGEAFLLRAGKPVAATVGAAIAASDVLRTGGDGALGVTFLDNTRVSLGPDTEVAVNEFTYQPTEMKLRFATSMSRGTAQFVTGVIGKLAPEKVTLETPAGTVGVRGTRFLIKVDE